MIVTIDGKAYDIPADQITTSRSCGMVGISGDTVTESDVVRVDEAALGDGLEHTGSMEIGRKRLYFELDDGEIVDCPVGKFTNRLECVWEFTGVIRTAECPSKLPKAAKDYIPAYKAEVALAALKEDTTLAEMYKKYDVHPALILEWKKQLQDCAHRIWQYR